MNKLWALTKIQLKDFTSRYTQQLNIKSKLLNRLMIVLPLFILFPAIEIVRQMYLSFAMIGFPELTMTYMYVATTMILFFMAIPLVVSVFFYSKDLTFIATLPVKEDTVVFSKLASVYVYLVALAAALFGASVGFYALADGLKLAPLLLGLLATLFTPLMPLIFATLVIVPFMTFIGGRKNRNLMVIVGNIVLLAVIIVMQLLFTRISMDPASLQKYLSSSDGLMALIGHRFPPSVWLTKMVLGSVMETVYYILLNLAFVVVLKFTAGHLYKGAMTKYNQQSSSGKKGKIAYKTRSKRLLLIQRHIGIIVHNPTFLLNTVMTIFIPILLFGIYAAMGLMSLETFKDPMFKPFGIYIFAGIISAPSLMGSLSATVITREGKTFWETRVLPVSIKENILTRILSSVIINTFATVILAAASFWILPLTPLEIVLALAFSMAANLAFSTLDIIVNILRPFINWSNPTAAIKNNMNIMIALLFRVVLGGLGYLMVKLLPDVGGAYMVALFTVLMTIVYFVAHALVNGRFRIKFIEMDV